MRLSRDDLIEEATRLTAELASSIRQLSDVRAVELRAKRASWINSPETSVSGRERDSLYNTIDLSVDVLELEGEIRAFTVELADIDRQLAYPATVQPVHFYLEES